MPQISSHYDTLQVSRDASADAIRAAYKRLARDYHPDRNRNSAESHRRMQSLNAAFEILTDSRRREQYDQWLEREERTAARLLRNFANVGPAVSQFTDGAHELADNFMESARRFFSVWLAPIALVAFLVWTLFVTRESVHRPDSVRSLTVNTSAEPQPPPAPSYEPPRTAPNGAAWPMQASEIPGYPAERADGKSIVTIDNSRNPADVFVKLVCVDNDNAISVRHVYVPAFGTFDCKNIRKGKYELRYQDLSNGSVSRSEPFELTETRTDRTVNYSVMKITLFKITDSKSAAKGLSVTEF
jgi:hypothetical protein